MKKINLWMIALLMIGMAACTSNTTRDSEKSAEEINENKNAVDEDASEFMVEAAGGGMMEVELGRMAANNSTVQPVKDFGAMMVRDHSKANEELKTLASAKNITLPAAMGGNHQKHVNDLAAKKGAEFDKDYINMMVDDHQHDIALFEKAARLKDADVSAFAAKTLPVLRTHLDSAKAIKSRLKM